MKIARLPTARSVGLFFIFLIFLPVVIHKLVFATTDHIVISEIQTGGTTPTDEFVELYNPTGSDIDLSSYRLTKKTQGGTESDLVSTLSATVAPHAYLLIAHADYTNSTVSADITYSENSLSSNNTVLLYSSESGTAVDKVGMGSATDVETDNTSSPANGRSVERKAYESSTKATMETSGTDEFEGNGYDTDNNSTDFVYRTLSDPQNSGSPKEPAVLLPTPTESPTPTLTPTPTYTPTPTNSPTPTNTPTPTPTDIPLVTPTVTPPPTPTPTPVDAGAPTTKHLLTAYFPGKTLTCDFEYRRYSRGIFVWYLPRLTCRYL